MTRVPDKPDISTRPEPGNPSLSGIALGHSLPSPFGEVAPLHVEPEPQHIRVGGLPAQCAELCAWARGHSDEMGTWRYVVSLGVHGESGKQSWEIRELYPADKGEPVYTEDSVHPFGNSYAELVQDIEHMRRDCRLDVLDLRGGASQIVSSDQVMSDLPADEGLTLAAADWEVPDELGKAIEDAAKISCVCGSTRFRVEMADANRKLTLAGAIVVAPALYQHDGDAITPDQKRAHDELHLKKIDLADAIFVADPGGHIGESTSREIAYAESLNKPVVRLSSVL